MSARVYAVVQMQYKFNNLFLFDLSESFLEKQ